MLQNEEKTDEKLKEVSEEANRLIMNRCHSLYGYKGQCDFWNPQAQ
jgi:hypothetical protein